MLDGKRRKPVTTRPLITNSQRSLLKGSNKKFVTEGESELSFLSICLYL